MPVVVLVGGVVDGMISSAHDWLHSAQPDFDCVQANQVHVCPWHGNQKVVGSC